MPKGADSDHAWLLVIMFELQSVSKQFAGVTALHQVSFTVTNGEIHALMGENGAGKSTLIKILTGQHTEFEGRITLDGQPFQPRGPRDARDRFGIACIHQELSLVPDLSIAENLFLAREPRTRWRTLDRERMQQQAREWLTRLGTPLDPSRLVRGLRTGEQQLVEIARALSLNARLLLLDEPTSALSDPEIAILMRVLEGLRKQGVTLIYVSHKLDEVFRLADRITVLRDGRMMGTRRTTEVDAPALLRMMAGRDVTLFGARAASILGPEVLRVEEMHVTAGNDNRALENISFTLRQGEVLGVAGLMGAGRTELLETLFGATPPRRVRARRFFVGGTERGVFRSPREALKAGISLVTEDRKLKSLVLPLSVRHNMTLTALKTFLTRGGQVRQRQETQAVREQIENLKLKTSGLDVPVAGLSGGNQQKVVLARCLLTNPRILLLDEPTRGVDVAAKSEIYRIIGELAGKGMAVLLASSEIPELLALCDRIMVLSEGRLSAVLDAKTATQESLLEAATANVRMAAKEAA